MEEPADGSAGPTSEPDAATEVRRVDLSAELLLNRASMALRGKRPSAAEFERVRTDATAVEDLVDEYLQTPDFGTAMRDLHNEALLVRVAPAIYPAGFPAIGQLASEQTQRLNRDLLEAPLRLIEHVIMNDKPYTDIVTADYTLANRTVASVWGLPYSGTADEWVETRWDDGRARAGILSDSMLFTRHGTTFSNANRGRANAMSRALLCYDFLSREVAIDSAINLADPDEVNDAVRRNEACASCHRTLDPLASYFDAYHPIYVPADVARYPVPHFLPTFESAIEAAPSAYFGKPGVGLDFLGAMMAQDPRFSLCAAKRFYAYFNQVSPNDVPADEAARLQRVFIASGMQAKALARAVILSGDFRFSHFEGDVDVGMAPLEPSGLLKVRPWQLAAVVEDLTGFRWKTELPVDIGGGEIGEVDLMSDSLFGFEVLAGGIDAMNVTIPSHTINPSMSLVLRALAARAAEFVVTADFAEPVASRRRLLTLVTASDESEAVVRKQLAALHERVLAEPMETDAPAIDDAYALFAETLGVSGRIARAWEATLFAMLQDVRIAYY